MRVLVLLLVLSLAGCVQPPVAEETTESPDDAGRKSRPGSSVGPDEEIPHSDLVLLRAPLRMVGGSQAATYDVEVPANATNVVVGIGSEPVTVGSDLRVELAGCGQAAWTGVQGSIGGRGAFGGRLCETPTPGRQRLTVENVGGYLDGTIEVLAWGPPVGNATAEP